MRADSVHGNISSEWKRRSEVLTMDDLEDVILKASSNIAVLKMNFMDFRKFTNGTRIRTKHDRGDNIIPTMEQIKTVEFRKGCRELFYKETHGDTEYKKSIFLKGKYNINQQFPALEHEIGSNTSKKEKIVKELVPHMPVRKQLFWREMSQNDNSKDLCFNQEE